MSGVQVGLRRRYEVPKAENMAQEGDLSTNATIAVYLPSGAGAPTGAYVTARRASLKDGELVPLDGRRNMLASRIYVPLNKKLVVEDPAW